MAKPSVTPIIEAQIQLRLLTEADLPMTLHWRNQDNIRRWFIHSDVITSQQHQAWFEQYNQKENDFVFIIEEQEMLGRPIGQVALYNIDQLKKQAEFGRLLIGEQEARGKGLARLATELLLTFAFDYFELNQIFLEVFDSNTPAITIYHQCGFKCTDQHGSLVTMSLLNPKLSGQNI